MIVRPPARPDAMRPHNLSLVLREIHRDGPLTRAQLTQRLGLSRSTIGALVADLADLDVLRESIPTGGTRAGRPSYLVGPHPTGPYVIAVDVDITQVNAAAVGIGGTVLARHVVATGESPRSPAQMAVIINEILPILRDRADRRTGPVAIGVSVPGTVDRHTGTVGFAPNLMWRDAAFGTELALLAGPGVVVTVGNDADLAVLAEHSRGAARDCSDVVFVIGRIGVGAGIIVNGLPLRGHDGHAGEIGHNVVDSSGPPCHCGKHGCLETYVGAAAMLAHAGIDEPATNERVRALLADAYEGAAGAELAVAAVARALGRSLASLVNIINPQLVVLGGSFADVLVLARAEIESSMEHYALEPPFETVRLAPAAFGTDSALIGAAEVAFTELLANPLGIATVPG